MPHHYTHTHIPSVWSSIPSVSEATPPFSKAATALSFGMMVASHFLMNWSVFPSVILPNSISILKKEKKRDFFRIYSKSTVLLRVSDLLQWETYQTWHIQEAWVFVEDFSQCRSFLWYPWSAPGVCILHCWFDWRNVLCRGPESFHKGDPLTGPTALPLVLLRSCSCVQGCNN